jgi:hypothetical protein
MFYICSFLEFESTGAIGEILITQPIHSDTHHRSTREIKAVTAVDPQGMQYLTDEKKFLR